MTEYNAAQEACIQGWANAIVDYPCDNGIEQAAALKDFLKEFNDIDPSNDLYVIMSYAGPGDTEPFLSGFTPRTGDTKKEVSKNLHKIMTDTIDVVEHYSRGHSLSVEGGASWVIVRLDEVL